MDFAPGDMNGFVKGILETTFRVERMERWESKSRVVIVIKCMVSRFWHSALGTTEGFVQDM